MISFSSDKTKQFSGFRIRYKQDRKYSTDLLFPLLSTPALFSAVRGTRPSEPLPTIVPFQCIFCSVWTGERRLGLWDEAAIHVGVRDV